MTQKLNTIKVVCLRENLVFVLHRYNYLTINYETSASRSKQPFEFYMWAGSLAALSQPGHILMYVPCLSSLAAFLHLELRYV